MSWYIKIEYYDEYWNFWYEFFVGDFQNNGITLEPRVVTLHGNHSYTLEHYYLFDIETTSHLFLSCDNYCEVWSNVWNWLGISSVTSVDLRQHFMQFTLMVGMPRASHLFLRAIWFATIWVIWKDRNNRIFKIRFLLLLL